MSLNQLYDEAFETDAQLQSVRSGLTADSEQLPQAREKLLPQLSASVTASEQRTELGGGFPASSENSNGYTVSPTQPLINVASGQDYQQGQIALTSAQAQFPAGSSGPDRAARPGVLRRSFGAGQRRDRALAKSIDCRAA